MSTEAQKAASARYDAKNTKLITLKLNLKTDADVLEHLDSVGNKQGYIKELIRKDMNAENRTEMRVIEGNFIEGEYVTVSVNNAKYTRKVRYSAKWGDLIITINGKEYAKYEFQ